MKNISILGITGSIGSSAKRILQMFPDEFNVHSISSHTSTEELIKNIDEFNPQYAVVTDKKAFDKLNCKTGSTYKNTAILCGKEGLKQIIDDPAVQYVVNGIAGIAGVLPSIWAARAGKTIALANKESIVCSGPLLFSIAVQNNAKIIPVDSEHAAIFALLENNAAAHVEKLYITASGGPFYKRPKNSWHTITPKEAIKHPTWNMGKKISIDSATMANKGLEVIEAHYLFNFPFNNIKVLIHPQSMIHGIIEMNDGSLLCHISPPDMSLPIQQAVFYPAMKYNTVTRLDLSKSLSLELHPVDFKQFPMLRLAYDCGNKGGIFPALYNIINEYLVNSFLHNEIGFLEIEQYTEALLTQLAGYSFDVFKDEHGFIEFVAEVNRIIMEKMKGIV